MATRKFAGFVAAALSFASASAASAAPTHGGGLRVLLGWLAAANLAVVAQDFGLRIAALALLSLVLCVALRRIWRHIAARRAPADPPPPYAPYALPARVAVALAAAARARR